jgi:hypothetical protein
MYAPRNSYLIFVSSPTNPYSAMSNVNRSKTWKFPWSYREGTIVTVAIILLGFVLQLIGGGTVLRLAGFPWNLISGIVFLGLIVMVFLFLKKHSLIKWLGSVKAALPAILGFTFLILLMGFVKQDELSKNSIVQLLGLNHLVKTWPFILINVYLLILIGIVTLKRLTPLNLKNAGFFLNHFGLFLVLFSTALGSSDIRTLNMDVYENQAESRATDENGKLVELPLTIKLLNFAIEEFRPKVAIIDNKSGEIVAENGHQLFQLLDRDAFDLSHYHLEVDTFFALSEPVDQKYLETTTTGSAPSAKVKVTNLKDKSLTSGWICSGSFNLNPEALRLDENHSLILLTAEPKKFSSEVSIITVDGKSKTTVIEVNRPFKIDGWTIYQIGYNNEMGRWSDMSVLQLVRDPWLPVVYTGIFLMMAGAIFLFIFGNPKNGGVENVA